MDSGEPRYTERGSSEQKNKLYYMIREHKDAYLPTVSLFDISPPFVYSREESLNPYHVPRTGLEQLTLW